MAKQTFTTGQVLTAAQMTSLQQTAMLGGSASAKTASYTLVAADAGTAITMSNASATTITVNTGLFAAGDIVTILNIGAGTCTITAGTATVSKPTNANLALVQNAGGILYFTATGAATFLPFDTGGTLGTWTTWTPTLTNITQGNGTVTARYLQDGQIVYFDFAFTMGSTSTMGSSPSFTLPVAIKTTTQFADGLCHDTGVQYWTGTGLALAGGSTVYMQYVGPSGSFIINAGITAAAPFTWGNTDVYRLHGFYEVN